MSYFAYPCPDCRTTTNLHDPSCRFAGTRRDVVEKAYTDILAVLSIDPQTETTLRDETHGRWDALHRAALGTLRREQRVTDTDAGQLELLTAAERKERITEPTIDPIRTIWERGSVPGCHDNAVFALIAWYEMVGLSWEETKQHVVEWFQDTGTWQRGGFEEASPEEVVESKRHVYDAGYGWKEKAQAAKAVIDRSLG